MIIPITKNPTNRFTIARIHYSLDPEKNTPEWVENAKRGMPERGWMREYEIDYSTYAGKPYFPEFQEFNIGSVEYQTGETLYRGWDFGFHRPCCIITKLFHNDQWGWKKVVLGQDESIMTFGKRVRNFCLAEYPGAKFIDACDPAGMQVNDKSEQTSIQILNALGIFPQTRKQPIKMGAEIIRQKLLMRADGKPGLIVDPSQTDVIDGFKGGLHYPEAKEGKEDEFYEKEGYYEHIFDCARYIAVEMFTVIGQTQLPNELTMDDGMRKHIMGRSQYSENEYGGLTAESPNELIEGGMDEYF